MIRQAGVISAVVLLVVTVVCAITTGSSGAFGSLAGGVLTIAFFAGGVMALDYMLRGFPAGLALVSALTIYLCQLLLVVAGALILSRATALDRTSIAWGVLGAAAGWILGQVRAFSRARIHVFDAVLPGVDR